ncbi:MAG TPA: serine/threonine-protein kinase [Verrucomicrobiae bacterium]|nr:serine/threonine-protein kinase [Verrucomicrobiae bacterium]
MDLQIGSTIGDYQVIGELGKGGMGRVLKVRNLISGRIEAMKVLLPDLAHDPQLADRFLREIRVQASLVHPNIAQMYAALRAENRLLMLMEFIEGESVEQLLRRARLPVPVAIDHFSQVLAALDYAHEKGVIHRDIKPANMMVAHDGTVKLMDFGIARAAADLKLTQTGMTVGSMYYMSPEQIQATGEIDRRADLYSAGITLYEMVTGKRPFDGDSAYAIMAAHLRQLPQPPVAIDPQLPEALNRAILKAIAKSPNDRFQTAAEFRGVLQQMVLARDVPAPQPAPPATRPVKTAPSHRTLWLIIGPLVTAAALVALIEIGPARVVHPQQVTPTPAPTSIAQPSPSPAPEPPAPTPAAPGLEIAVTPAPVQISRPTPVPRRESPTPAPAPTPPPGPGPTPAPTPAPAPDNPELKQVREQWALLTARASAMRQWVETMRKTLAAQGLSVRADALEADAELVAYLRLAETAIGSADVAEARDALSKAAGRIEFLEKVSGKSR